MAIETHPDRAQPAGSGSEAGGPGGVMRPWWLRPGAHIGVIAAVIGYILGHLLGNLLSSDYARNALSDTNEVPIVLGYLFAVIGWLAGLGVFNDPVRLMLGKPLLAEIRRGGGEVGLSKYFRYTLDHKVVGIQYLFGMIGYFLTGGLFAMAIRSELLSPSYHLIGPNQYLMAVGEHGTMMMMMMSSVILGPFGQYFGPLLIGSKLGRVPAARGASAGADPGLLRDPAVGDPTSAGSRPAGPATSRWPPRPGRARTPTSSRSA